MLSECITLFEKIKENVPINYEEASRYYGISMSKLTKLVSQDKIPYMKIGMSVRFDPAEIKQWMIENGGGRTDGLQKTKQMAGSVARKRKAAVARLRLQERSSQV